MNNTNDPPRPKPHSPALQPPISPPPSPLVRGLVRGAGRRSEPMKGNFHISNGHGSSSSVAVRMGMHRVPEAGPELDPLCAWGGERLGTRAILWCHHQSSSNSNNKVVASLGVVLAILGSSGATGSNSKDSSWLTRTSRIKDSSSSTSSSSGISSSRPSGHK